MFPPQDVFDFNEEKKDAMEDLLPSSTPRSSFFPSARGNTDDGGEEDEEEAEEEVGADDASNAEDDEMTSPSSDSVSSSSSPSSPPERGIRSSAGNWALWAFGGFVAVLTISLCFPPVRRIIMAACERCFVHMPRIFALTRCFRSARDGNNNNVQVASFRRHAQNYSEIIRLGSLQGGNVTTADTAPIMEEQEGEEAKEEEESGGEDGATGQDLPLPPPPTKEELEAPKPRTRRAVVRVDPVPHIIKETDV